MGGAGGFGDGLPMVAGLVFRVGYLIGLRLFAGTNFSGFQK